MDQEIVDAHRLVPERIWIETVDGDRTLTVSRDIPALRYYLLEEVLDGQQVSIPAYNVMITLPDAGLIMLSPEQVRAQAEALIAARQIEDGQPLRAITNVGGVDYAQGADEVTPEFEQRVIQDIMLRRGRELMRERGLTAEEAAIEVSDTLERQGISNMDAGNPAIVMSAPTSDVTRRLRSFSEEDHSRLARIIAEWYLVPAISSDDRALVDRAGLTEANIRWFNIHILEGMDKLPDTVLEPTAREVWAD